MISSGLINKKRAGFTGILVLIVLVIVIASKVTPAANKIAQGDINIVFGNVSILDRGYIVDAVEPLVLTPDMNAGRIFVIAETDGLMEGGKVFLLAVFSSAEECILAKDASLEADSVYGLITQRSIGAWSLYTRTEEVAGVSYESYMAVNGNIMILTEAPYDQKGVESLLTTIMIGETSLDPAKHHFNTLSCFGNIGEWTDDGHYVFSIGEVTLEDQGLRVVASTLNGDDLETALEDFRTYSMDLYGEILVDEADLVLIRIQADDPGTGDLIYYYQLAFVSFDALILSTVQLADLSVDTLNYLDEEIISWLNIWKEQTSLLTLR